MNQDQIKAIVAQMTLEEKAALCSGDTDWTTSGVPRLGVPPIWVSDGPYGLRKETTVGIDEASGQPIKETVPAICFPAGVTSAASFDTGLMTAEGQALGRNCAANDVAVLLGPALNIKRSPLCGRNFEYFSEDPYLAGQIAAAYIQGVQSMGVGTSAKHFAANSQEHRRMTSSSEVDERTLREIYLTGFEIAVKEAQPWTIMASYNKINGTYASQNKKLLSDILVDEWGFQGFVVSDWGAVHDRSAAVAAGCALTMPEDKANDTKLVDAVNTGRLDEAALDLACEKILGITYRYVENRMLAEMDLESDSALARKIAVESMVLLKNDGMLPMSRSARTLLVGPFAKNPRYQGGGSSKTKSLRVHSALDILGDSVDYLPGFSDSDPTANDRLLADVLAQVADYEQVVVFAGLPESMESEGYDRQHLDLPAHQNRLIAAVAERQPQ
ncbi:MAG TPA: glycosyl hydrolase, partial [Clostridiales bacterium]|nr:glycosyl hydrolase [Clostridiales bacterium]